MSRCNSRIQDSGRGQGTQENTKRCFKRFKIDAVSVVIVGVVTGTKHLSGVKAAGGAEGSSTNCSLENFEIGLPHMQAPAQESRWLSYCELLLVSCLRLLLTVCDLFFAVEAGHANVSTGPHKVTWNGTSKHGGRCFWRTASES